MNITAIKDSVLLTDAAALCDVSLQPGEHRQPCPFCGSTTGFKTTRNKYYICYKCKHKGDVFMFLQDLGKVHSFKEALAYLGQHTVKSASYHQQQRQSRGLETVFNIYQQEAQKHKDKVLKYLTGRGWSAQMIDRIGFASSWDVLRRNGMSEEELLSLELLYKDNYVTREYYGEHIVFPIRAYHNNIVHLSGRCLDPTNTLRWKHTKGTPSINNYLYNAAGIKDKKVVFLTEGISDCESLCAMDIPAAAVFGINIPLVHNAHLFKDAETIVCIFDRDKYPKGTPQEGQYKSWTCILPHIINLAVELKIPIFCLMVPDWPGVKDVNEYLQEIEYDRTAFNNYGAKAAISVHKFAFEMYKDDLSMHDQLWKLLEAVPERHTENLLTSYIQQKYNSWPNYLKELYGI